MENLEELLTNSQKGDKDAFGKIYHLFNKRIYRYCYFNLGNSHQAEDICQETFLKAWKSLSSITLSAGGSLQAYLFRIARNCIIDLSRKKKELPLEQAKNVEASDTADGNLDRQEKIREVQLALSALKEEEKQLMILRFFEELSFAEIAKILNTREGALRVKAHRVLKKLKDILEQKI
ncbi:MAG: RNA polymerase sigma factor [Patescibacteria group bacterium]|nr:RNA polymerase sigma factor [Patescibacteria group bacterium]